VANQLSGLVVGADQRRVGHHDLDQGLARGDRPHPQAPARAIRADRAARLGGLGGVGRVVVARLAVIGTALGERHVRAGDQLPGEQADQQVRPPGIHRAGVLRTQPAGQPRQPLEGPRSVRRGQQRPQRGHALGFLPQADPPVVAGAAMPLGGPLRIHRQNRAAERDPRLRQALLRRAGQHPGLDRPGQLVRQHDRRLVNDPRLGGVDISGLPQRVRRRLRRAQRSSRRPGPRTSTPTPRPARR
jgi:hypothetical protein